MIDISVRNLTKFFVIGENLLEGLSFEIQEGECVAILGRNGCGKTTLLKILTGEMDYDDGEVFVNPNKRLGLISQIPRFPEGYTVEDVLRSAYRDLLSAKKKMEVLEQKMSVSVTDDLLREYDALVNRFQAGGGYDMDVEVDKVCNGLGITADQRSQEFDSLSGGEKTRVNLARLLLEKTDILLLDEPTNHLDLRSVEWLESYINAFKGTVLAISHDRFFLDRIAHRVIEIVDGHAEFYSGNYSFYIEEKQARFNLQLKQYEQEQAKLKQLGYTVERMKGWGINNRTLYRRAMSIQHRMERIKKTEKPKTEKTMKATFGEKDLIQISVRRYDLFQNIVVCDGKLFNQERCRSAGHNRSEDHGTFHAVSSSGVNIPAIAFIAGGDIPVGTVLDSELRAFQRLVGFAVVLIDRQPGALVLGCGFKSKCIVFLCCIVDNNTDDIRHFGIALREAGFTDLILTIGQAGKFRDAVRAGGLFDGIVLSENGLAGQGILCTGQYIAGSFILLKHLDTIFIRLILHREFIMPGCRHTFTVSVDIDRINRIVGLVTAKTGNFLDIVNTGLQIIEGTLTAGIRPGIGDQLGCSSITEQAELDTGQIGGLFRFALSILRKLGNGYTSQGCLVDTFQSQESFTIQGCGIDLESVA